MKLNYNRIIKSFATVILSLTFISVSFSQLTVSKLFSDNCVLQRDVVIPVTGKASPNDNVYLKFNDKKYSTTADANGNWTIELPEMKAGGPYDITINSNVNEIKIVNILIGDIWLAGGQSNMEWFVEASLNAEEEIKNANYPNIRIFDVPHKMSSLPQENFEGGEWYEVTPNSIEQFSAVGYYFGRNIYQNINIPIGIIGNNWGGTVVQTWMSPKAFAGLSKYEKEIAKLKKVNLEKESQKSKTQFDSWLGDFYNLDQGIKNDKYIWAQDDMDYSSWKEMRLPQVWELSGDTALFEKDGVVWFQRSFDVGNIDDEKEIKLSLGAIDDSDKTWINGELVGEMYNRYNKNRVYKIEKGILKQGKNSIVVRVEDYTGAGGFTADKSDFFISIGEQKINLTGLWHYKIGMQPKTPLPKNIFGPNIFPTLLYNGMIYPMKDFPIKGVIWYQGESNVYNAFEYRELFKRWIKDWRAVWHNPQLPFIWVQIANFGEEQLQPKESTWAELREAQEMALELPNTKMITSIDIGEGKNIHPQNKQEVGRRLSCAALDMVYNKENQKYQGPKYLKHDIKKKHIEITFDNTADGLIVSDKYGYVKGFTIAGEDKQFHWAKAYIIGKNIVKVWSDKVKKPVAVRYAWEDNPEDANLFNSDKLPTFPFRTDSWKLSTEE